MKLIKLAVSRTAIFSALGFAILCLGGGCDTRDSAANHAADAKNVLTLSKENFQTEVLSSPQPVLVDFWATWCGPCKMVAPTVAELATEFEGKAKVGKVDVDAQTELAKQYNISAIPALMIFKDGKVVEQFVGVRSKGELKAALDKVVAGSVSNTTASNP